MLKVNSYLQTYIQILILPCVYNQFYSTRSHFDILHTITECPTLSRDSQWTVSWIWRLFWCFCAITGCIAEFIVLVHQRNLVSWIQTMYPDFSPGVFTEFWYVSKELNANRWKITNDFGVCYTEVVKYQLNWSDGSDVLREQLKVHVFTLLHIYTKTEVWNLTSRSYWGSLENTRVSWKRKVHYRIFKSLLLVPQPNESSSHTYSFLRSLLLSGPAFCSDFWYRSCMLQASPITLLAWHSDNVCWKGPRLSKGFFKTVNINVRQQPIINPRFLNVFYECVVTIRNNAKLKIYLKKLFKSWMPELANFLHSSPTVKIFSLRSCE